MHNINHQIEEEIILEELREYSIKNNKANTLLSIIEPLDDSHLNYFKIRPEQAEAIPDPLMFKRSVSDCGGRYNLAGTVDGHTFLCVGILPMWDGVGEIWTMFSEDASKHFKHNTREFLQTIRHYLELVPYRRLQTIVKKDFKIGQKFVEHLGFKKEGLLKQYDMHKRDYYRYALLKEES